MPAPDHGCGAAQRRHHATDATPSPTESKERSTSRLDYRTTVHEPASDKRNHARAQDCIDTDGPGGRRIASAPLADARREHQAQCEDHYLTVSQITDNSASACLAGSGRVRGDQPWIATAVVACFAPLSGQGSW